MRWSWEETWGVKNGSGRVGSEEWIWESWGEEKEWTGSKHTCRYEILKDSKTILKTAFGEYTEACHNDHNWFIVQSNSCGNSSLNSWNSVSLAVSLIRREKQIEILSKQTQKLKGKCSEEQLLGPATPHHSTVTLQDLLGCKEKGNSFDMKNKVGFVLCHTLQYCYRAVGRQSTKHMQTWVVTEPTRRDWIREVRLGLQAGGGHQAKVAVKNLILQVILCHPIMCHDTCTASFLKFAP